MSEPALKPLTFDEVEAIEDRDGLRYELWDGELVAMTGGTPAHNLIALGLRDAIKPQLTAGCDVYVADVGLRFSRDAHSNKAYPDIMVVCNPHDDTFQTDPALVVEVLSDSSVHRDRAKKLKAYTALDSVHVYLILSQTAVMIEVYRRTNDWREEIYHGGDAVIELLEPRLRSPLRAIYADVSHRLTGARYLDN